MIKIIGNDIMRGGEKIGWVEGSHIYDKGGEKLGYVEGSNIYSHDGKKLAYIEGDHLKSEDGAVNIRLDENREQISGGSEGDATRAAIRMLLGD